MKYFKVIKIDGVSVDSINIMQTDSLNWKEGIAKLKADGLECKEIGGKEHSQLQEMLAVDKAGIKTFAVTDENIMGRPNNPKLMN